MQRTTTRTLSVAIAGLLVFDAVVHRGLAAQGNEVWNRTETTTAQPVVRMRDRARWIADYPEWRSENLRRAVPVFSFDRLAEIFADQRRIDSLVEAFHVSHELTVIWLDKLDQASDDAESENLHADLTEAHRAYEALLTEYQRLVREATDDGGAGLLGALASMAVHFVGTSVAGPIIGAAVSSGFDRAINGGSLPEVIFAMGVSAGATFAARLAGAEMVGELSERGFTDANSIVGGVVVSLSVQNLGNAFKSDVLDAPSHAITSAFTPAPVWPLTSATDQAAAATVAAWPRGIPANVRDLIAAGDPASRTGDRSLEARVQARRMARIDPGQRVLTANTYLGIRADLRYIEAQIDTYHIGNELSSRYLRGLDRLFRQFEIINLHADLVDARQAYDELYARYRDLKAKLESRSGRLLGAIVSFVGAVFGTVVGGPVLGAALAGAAGVAVEGGNAGEALFTAGLYAGIAHVSSQVLNNYLETRGRGGLPHGISPRAGRRDNGVRRGGDGGGPAGKRVPGAGQPGRRSERRRGSATVRAYRPDRRRDGRRRSGTA